MVSGFKKPKDLIQRTHPWPPLFKREGEFFYKNKLKYKIFSKYIKERNNICSKCIGFCSPSLKCLDWTPVTHVSGLNIKMIRGLVSSKWKSLSSPCQSRRNEKIRLLNYPVRDKIFIAQSNPLRPSPVGTKYSLSDSFQDITFTQIILCLLFCTMPVMYLWSSFFHSWRIRETQSWTAKILVEIIE